LNKRQVTAIKYIKEKGAISNNKYREINENTSRITATRDLTKLVEKKILIMTGTGKRNVYYILNDAKNMQ